MHFEIQTAFLVFQTNAEKRALWSLIRPYLFMQGVLFPAHPRRRTEPEEKVFWLCIYYNSSSNTRERSTASFSFLSEPRGFFRANHEGGANSTQLYLRAPVSFVPTSHSSWYFHNLAVNSRVLVLLLLGENILPPAFPLPLFRIITCPRPKRLVPSRAACSRARGV